MAPRYSNSLPSDAAPLSKRLVSQTANKMRHAEGKTVSASESAAISAANLPETSDS
jgi:hypothetical protein